MILAKGARAAATAASFLFKAASNRRIAIGVLGMSKGMSSAESHSPRARAAPIAGLDSSVIATFNDCSCSALLASSCMLGAAPLEWLVTGSNINGVYLEQARVVCIVKAPFRRHESCFKLAVEVMANSDNVIRGGLTNKPIDKQNFLSLVGRSPARGERITPQVRDGVHQWRAPVEDFLLHNIEGEINQRMTLTDWAIAFLWRGSVDVSPQRSGEEVFAQERISQSKGALLARGEYLFKGSGSLWVVSGKGR